MTTEVSWPSHPCDAHSTIENPTATSDGPMAWFDQELQRWLATERRQLWWHGDARTSLDVIATPEAIQRLSHYLDNLYPGGAKQAWGIDTRFVEVPHMAFDDCTVQIQVFKSNLDGQRVGHRTEAWLIGPRDLSLDEAEAYHKLKCEFWELTLPDLLLAVRSVFA